MSSFRRISDGFPKEIEDNDPDLITIRDEPDTIRLYGRKYRKANHDSQEEIYHYIFSLKNCHKIYIKTKGWFVEVKDHSPCLIHCKDEFGGKRR